MRLKVYHRTEYAYANAVINNSNEVRLSPKLTKYQEVETNFISVLPATRLTRYTDLNFNRVHRFNIPQPHQQLTIDSRFTVKTKKPFEIDSLPYGYAHIELKKCSQNDTCHTYLQDSSFVEKTPHIWREALDIQANSTDVFQTCSALMDFIYSDFTYASGATQVTTR
ncbi:MAG: transglutaminase N-terminal domain-containing protein, partial [Verrucomicrobiota bacterium]|nr:transglutaminase N-terminal domain-containing protein [Verrucomicrobiota bacterium]